MQFVPAPPWMIKQGVNGRGEQWKPYYDKIYQYCEKQRRHLLDEAEALEDKEGSNNASSHMRAAAAVYGDVMDFVARQEKEPLSEGTERGSKVKQLD